MFPFYVNESGDGYIFSAANNLCSVVEITAAYDKALISETYKDKLIENLYNAGKAPNPAYFAPV